MMQMIIVITLHVNLFLRQFIKNHSIILEKRLTLQKIAFCIESKAEFLGELNFNTWEDSASSLLYIYSKFWCYAQLI